MSGPEPFDRLNTSIANRLVVIMFVGFLSFPGELHELLALGGAHPDVGYVLISAAGDHGTKSRDDIIVVGGE